MTMIIERQRRNVTRFCLLISTRCEDFLPGGGHHGTSCSGKMPLEVIHDLHTLERGVLR